MPTMERGKVHAIQVLTVTLCGGPQSIRHIQEFCRIQLGCEVGRSYQSAMEACELTPYWRRAACSTRMRPGLKGIPNRQGGMITGEAGHTMGGPGSGSVVAVQWCFSSQVLSSSMQRPLSPTAALPKKSVLRLIY
jgi:hypothetical protein